MATYRKGGMTVQVNDKSLLTALKLQSEMQKGVRRSALMLVAEVKDGALGTTGRRSSTYDPSIPRLYWNKAEQTYTQSSEPGSPPHKQRGQLRESISAEYSSDGLTAKVGSRDKLAYGRIHELGGFAKFGFLPPRPYLRPSLEKLRSTINRILKDAIRRGLS